MYLALATKCFKKDCGHICGTDLWIVNRSVNCFVTKVKYLKIYWIYYPQKMNLNVFNHPLTLL